MAIEVNSGNIVCCKCGQSYSRRKGYFAVNYGSIYKGIGHLTVCKDCVDEMYTSYLAKCNDSRTAVRQVCRKLDLYWSDAVFDSIVVKTTTRTIMTTYIARINTKAYIGKSYDDTLSDEGTLWNFLDTQKEQMVSDEKIYESRDIPADVIAFWGRGYTSDMYEDLEQRRHYWMSKLNPNGDYDLDIGTEAIIRQICSLELDINRDRAEGRPVDKSINALNNLLGSANLKPAQKQKEDNDAVLNNTPMGVWLYRYENKRPLPDNYEDSHILKYVFTWMGHVMRMLGIKNSYEKLYQSEIDRLRVEKPEYSGDDESLMMDYMNESSEKASEESQQIDG